MFLSVILDFQHPLVWRCRKLLVFNIVVDSLHVASNDWVDWCEDDFTHSDLLFLYMRLGCCRTWHSEIVVFIRCIETLAVFLVSRWILSEWWDLISKWNILLLFIDGNIALKMAWQFEFSSGVNSCCSLCFRAEIEFLSIMYYIIQLTWWLDYLPFCWLSTFE